MKTVYLVTQEQHCDCIGLPAQFTPEVYTALHVAKERVKELEKNNGKFSGVYYDYEPVKLYGG